MKVYWPVSLVVNSRLNPVAKFDSVTTAPGTGPLFGSVIVPASCALTACVCPHTGTHIRSARRDTDRVLIHPPVHDASSTA